MSKLLNYQKSLLDYLNKEKSNPNNKLGLKPNAIIEPYDLRLEVALTKANSYKFPLLDSDQKTSTLTERRLKAGELFVPYAMSLQLYVRATNVPGSEVFAKLHTFVDALAFTGTAPFNPAHLEAIYNADLSFTRQRNIVIPAINTRKFKYIPTQQSTATLQSEIDMDSAFVPVLDTKIIQGNGQNEINLEALPFDYNWQNTIPADNKENRLALLLAGFRIIQ